MTKEELREQLRKIGIIYKESVILRSGRISNFYCDVKKGYGYPDILSALADEVGRNIPKEVTCIAASGYGGLPLASVVASRFGLKFTAVRSTPKKHGKGEYIDGYVPTEADSVLIIDDVLTTGSSLLETIKNMKGTEAKIDSAIVVVKRGEPNLPISYSYLFDIKELSGAESV